jgi:monolysocardiolipin acyltransferase
MTDVLREKQAVARWRPGIRWYHPAMATLVIAACRFVTSRLNQLEIEGTEFFEQVLYRSGRGLLTVSNHVSLFDDPLVIANLVRGSYDQVRWVGADALNFFGSAPKSWLFTAGKSVPIIRGMGVNQPGMRFLRDRLLAGDWVHMFPEGGRTRDPEAKMAAHCRPGSGWLIAESRPIVLPFYHYGIHKVLPVGGVRPRTGKTIRARFGQPIDCDEDWLKRIASRSGDHLVGPLLWDAISAELHRHLLALERVVHPSLTSEQAAL